MGDQAIKQLQEIIEKQKTVSTSKLTVIAGVIVEEFRSARNIINAQRKELGLLRKGRDEKLVAQERELVRLREIERKHKIAMQDYENLKKNYHKVKEEYRHLVRLQEEINKFRRGQKR